MNNIRIEPSSPEQARKQAEQYRREIAATLEALGEKLNHATEKAEETRERVREKIDDVEHSLRRPLDWVRANPGRAIGLGLAAGFMWALRSRSRRKARLGKDFNVAIPIEALHRAYLKGRKDERKGLEEEPKSFWREFKGDGKERKAAHKLERRDTWGTALRGRAFHSRLPPAARLRQSFTDLVRTIREGTSRVRRLNRF